MENTPFGKPASCSNSAKRMSVKGTFSLGFMIRQFPQPSAMGSVHSGTIAGKLKGTIDATTPRGRLTSWQWTPRDTSRILPASRSGSPVAQDTVSMPFKTSASASPLFLPCSFTTRYVSSFKLASAKLLKRNKTSTRALTPMSLQAGNAIKAAFTALSTSSAPHSGTRAISSPVAGLVTEMDELAAEATHSPPMKFFRTGL
mmetsp:Transcript_36706/g.59180  ORF Transcript_36706/g.59180 Transcript_36706/m.59180 type:complete len:201 (-) Transcript_36706:164-766(-)